MVQSEEICGLNADYYLKQKLSGRLHVLKSMLEIVVSNMEFLQTEMEWVEEGSQHQPTNGSTVRLKRPHNKAKVGSKPKFCVCEEMHSHWWKYCASCGGKIKRKTSTLA